MNNRSAFDQTISPRREKSINHNLRRRLARHTPPNDPARVFILKLCQVTKSAISQSQISSDADFLEIIVELEQQSKFQMIAEQTGVHSRTAQIAARKESFARISSPVETAISQAGGEVTEKAWINRTLRAKLPVKSLEHISELREVEKLDSPRGIEPDSKD